MTEKEITKALRDKDWKVCRNAIRNKNATPEHISIALKDENWDVRMAAIRKYHKLNISQKASFIAKYGESKID